jgi:hypothetical protein
MIDSARHQWEEGARRLEREGGDSVRYLQLQELVGIVHAALRRRLGQRFTLAELATLYARADDWVRELVVDSLPPEPRVGSADTSLVLDAAFHVFARGAIDFAP